jgi:signal transduction histidine kinase
MRVQSRLPHVATGGLSAWDVALGGIASALLIGEAVAEQTGSPVPIVLAVAMGGSLAVGRRFPIASYLVSSAALLLLAGLYYDAGLYPYPNAFSLYRVGAHAATRVRAVVGLVVGLGGIVTYWTLVPSTGIPWLPGLIVAGWALAWVAGQGERQRRRAAADVVRRAEEAEQRRESERAAAVAQERTRMAHEVHDIVGHALNVMVLQAGAGRRMLDRDPQASAAALATVEQVGRDALADLDQALAVLDTPTDRRPARGLADVDDLAAQVTGAGVPVRVSVEGSPRPLTTPVDLAAFRIVQEALTNVTKHAPGTPAEVEIAYDDDALRLRVTDRAPARPGSRTGTGRGLASIRDRVEALGGTVEAGPDPAGGWSVRCSIPVTR